MALEDNINELIAVVNDLTKEVIELTSKMYNINSEEKPKRAKKAEVEKRELDVKIDLTIEPKAGAQTQAEAVSISQPQATLFADEDPVTEEDVRAIASKIAIRDGNSERLKAILQEAFGIDKLRGIPAEQLKEAKRLFEAEFAQ